jgi:LacI family transcriptional regulator
LREVARAAGVSTASASRALARKGAVSADLRQRILAAAERLGYTPNLAARSLAARRSGLIGVLVNTLAEPLVAEVVAALEHRLAEAGYAIVIVATRGSPGDSLTALRGLLGRGAEGFVLAEPAHARELATALRARGLPWIGMAAEADGVEFTVADGHRRGAELAGRYLLSLGHRHIGVIAPTAATLAGVAEALAGSEVPLPAVGPPLVRDLDAAQSAMRLLLDGDDPPTAVICGSDLQALAAVRTCLGQGVTVPGAVSIVGFGDAEFARRTVPALTTVRIPATRLGFRLAEGLLACLEQQGAPLIFDTPVKLVVRESTGPAAR